MSIILNTEKLISNVLSNSVATAKTPIVNVMAKNGKFKMFRSPVLTSIVQDDTLFADLPEMQPSVTLNIPKLPFHVFEIIGSFFKKVYAKDKTEASCMVFYNRVDDEFIVWPPDQQNSTALSKYQRDDDPAYVEMCSKYILTMVAHSHPWASTYAPSPSGTDNDDEKEPLLYMILSNVDGIPTYTLSTCPNAVRRPLRFDDVFEIPSIVLTREEKYKLLVDQKVLKDSLINKVFMRGATDEEFDAIFNEYADLTYLVPKLYTANVDEVPADWMARCAAKTYGYTPKYDYDNYSYNRKYVPPAQTPPAQLPASTAAAPAAPSSAAAPAQRGMTDAEYEQYTKQLSEQYY